MTKIIGIAGHLPSQKCDIYIIRNKYGYKHKNELTFCALVCPSVCHVKYKPKINETMVFILC